MARDLCRIIAASGAVLHSAMARDAAQRLDAFVCDKDDLSVIEGAAEGARDTAPFLQAARRAASWDAPGLVFVRQDWVISSIIAGQRAGPGARHGFTSAMFDITADIRGYFA
jgi:hypothetical protein